MLETLLDTPSLVLSVALAAVTMVAVLAIIRLRRRVAELSDELDRSDVRISQLQANVAHLEASLPRAMPTSRWAPTTPAEVALQRVVELVHGVPEVDGSADFDVPTDPRGGMA